MWMEEVSKLASTRPRHQVDGNTTTIKVSRSREAVKYCTSHLIRIQERSKSINILSIIASPREHCVNSCHSYMPRLNSTIPFAPPFSQNSFSKLLALTACRWGNAPKARGNAKIEVTNTNPRFAGITILGLCRSHCVLCNLNKPSAGNTMIGVAFNTLLIAVSPTAIVAAFLLLPRLSNLPFFRSSAIFCVSSRTG